MGYRQTSGWSPSRAAKITVFDSHWRVMVPNASGCALYLRSMLSRNIDVATVDSAQFCDLIFAMSL
jgi:hypothetical protein